MPVARATVTTVRGRWEPGGSRWFRAFVGGMVCFVGNGLRNCFLSFVRLQLLCLGVKF